MSPSVGTTLPPAFFLQAVEALRDGVVRAIGSRCVHAVTRKNLDGRFTREGAGHMRHAIFSTTRARGSARARHRTR